jgi:hypothetical protein
LQAVFHAIDSVLLPKRASAARAATTGHHHRKLLDQRTSDFTFAQTGAMDATATAITAAAGGYVSTEAATKVGSYTAENVGFYDNPGFQGAYDINMDE